MCVFNAVSISTEKQARSTVHRPVRTRAITHPDVLSCWHAIEVNASASCAKPCFLYRLDKADPGTFAQSGALIATCDNDKGKRMENLIVSVLSV